MACLIQCLILAAAEPTRGIINRQFQSKEDLLLLKIRARQPAAEAIARPHPLQDLPRKMSADWFSGQEVGQFRTYQDEE